MSPTGLRRSLGLVIITSLTATVTAALPVNASPTTALVSTAPATLRADDGTLQTLRVGTPKFVGNPIYDKYLAVKPGNWTPHTTLSYHWYGNDQYLGTTAQPKLYIDVSYVGLRITVQVDGTKAGYADASRTSKPSKAVTMIPVKYGKKKQSINASLNLLLQGFNYTKYTVQQHDASNAGLMLTDIISRLAALYNAGAPPKHTKKQSRTYRDHAWQATQLGRDVVTAISTKKFATAVKKMNQLEKRVKAIITSVNKGYNKKWNLADF